MAYKVIFYTLATLGDGKIGNLRQGDGVIYTDKSIEEIPTAVNNDLLARGKEQVGIITSIEETKGHCI